MVAQFENPRDWLLRAHYDARCAMTTTEIIPQWFRYNEIRIFWEPGIKKDTIELIQTAILERARFIGANLKIELWGTGWQEDRYVSIMDYLRPVIDVSGNLLWQEIGPFSYRERYRQLRQHGDVYITTRQLAGDAASWGMASFHYGVMTFALYGQRQWSHNFLRRVTLHETTHLLGFMHHCDDVQVKGYDYDPQCNMHWACASERICMKCYDYVCEWWNEAQRHIK